MTPDTKPQVAVEQRHLKAAEDFLENWPDNAPGKWHLAYFLARHEAEQLAVVGEDAKLVADLRTTLDRLPAPPWRVVGSIYDGFGASLEVDNESNFGNIAHVRQYETATALADIARDLPKLLTALRASPETRDGEERETLQKLESYCYGLESQVGGFRPKAIRDLFAAALAPASQTVEANEATDLLTRLVTWEDPAGKGYPCFPRNPDGEEAAAEIHRLRDALDALRGSKEP